MKRQIEEIENGKKFSFKIYETGGDKYSIGPFTREKAKEIKKKLDANDEVYIIHESKIGDNMIELHEIKSL